jgi:YggT family protein
LSALLDAVVLAAVTRDDVADYVAAFFRVWSLLIIAYIVMSLVFAFARVPYNRWLMRVFEFLKDVSEPLLAPFRRIIPSLGPFDFSPILALIALSIVGSIVVSLIRG